MFRTIAINTVVSFGARVIGLILGFFVLAFTARTLGVQGFGLYSTALSWAYIFSFIADLGLYNLLAKEIGQASPEDEKKVIGNVVGLRLAALIVCVGIGIIASLFFSAWLGITPLAVIIASLMYVCLSLSQVLMAVFQKHLRMGWPALAEIVGRAFILGGLLLLLYQSPESLDYHIFLLFPALAGAIGLVINMYAARRVSPFEISADIPLWHTLFKKTLPIGLSILLTAVYFKLDTLFIAFFRGQEEVGLYNAAYRILENLIFFPAALVGILMPHLSRSAASDVKQFTSYFQHAFDILLIATLPLVCGIVFEAEPIMRLITGQDFVVAAPALTVLAFAIGLIFFSTLFSQSFIALDKQHVLLKVYGGGALVNILANIFVIPSFGYVGAAVTTLWTETLVAFFMIFLLEKQVAFQLTFARFLPSLIATALMGLFLYVSDFSLIITVPLAALLYVLVLRAAGGIKKEEIKELLTS